MTKMWPDSQSHPRYTDTYFNLTRKILQEHGDIEVTYAVFMRRPVTLASNMAIDWLYKMTEERGMAVKIENLFKEGAWVGAENQWFTFPGAWLR